MDTDFTEVERKLIFDEGEMLLVRAAGIGLWDWRPASGEFFFSRQLKVITGYSEEELMAMSRPMREIFLAEGVETRRQCFALCFSGKTDEFDISLRVRRVDGEVIWLQERGVVAERDASGAVLRIGAVVQDVTAFKHEQELTLAEKQQREYVAHLAGLGGWEWHVNGDFMSFDDDYRQLLGYRPEEMDGHIDHVADLVIHPDDRGVFDAMRAYAAHPEGVFSYKLRLRHQSGRYIWVHDIGSVVEWDREGRPTLMRGGVLDIDKMVRAEEDLRALIAEREMYSERLEHEVEKAVSGLRERDTLLQAVNGAACLLFEANGTSFDNAVSTVLRVLGESIHADRAYLWRSEISEGQLCCSEVGEWARVEHTDFGGLPSQKVPYDVMIPQWRKTLLVGKNINMTISQLPPAVRDLSTMRGVKSVLAIPVNIAGEFWGFMGFEDCTKERVFNENEQNIMKSGGMLLASAIMRQELNKRLVEAKETALASVNAKTEFLSRMSHEIRTPMNAIIGMNEIAKRSDDIERIKQCLEKIDSSSRQLLGIINDVLDMSKIDANKLEITKNEFDFEEMMKNVFNVVQVKIDEKKIDFFYDFDTVFKRNMVCDELRLAQVLINLLSNSVKFTADFGHIVLRVREIEKKLDASVLRFEVVDDGIGMTPEQLARLFKPFTQADGGITRTYGGTGLGLAICKKIVELMGGRIWTESEQGQGTTFAFEIEVEWGASRDGTIRHKLSDSLGILVVDDIQDVREYFTSILQSFSLRCDTASSGEAAIDAVRMSLERDEPYDVIFIDWKMPGMNGIETAREINRLMDDDVIVIMISAFDWTDAEREATNAGITHFLSKPVLPSELYNTIVRLTNRTFVTDTRDEEAETHDWRGKTILLAEDIEINREIVSSILEDTGVEIQYAVDGLEAVSLYYKNSERYDLILMDIQMPGLDGIAATKKIRASGTPKAATVPIIAMTANAFKEDERECLEAGMDGHIAKPIDISQLLHILQEYLS